MHSEVRAASFKFRFLLICTASVIAFNAFAAHASGEAGDLDEIKKSGVLRHLGVPYANFVTGSGDGMDVEIIRSFAESLGVRYEYVKRTGTKRLETLLAARSSQKETKSK